MMKRKSERKDATQTTNRPASGISSGRRVATDTSRAEEEESIPGEPIGKSLVAEGQRALKKYSYKKLLEILQTDLAENFYHTVANRPRLIGKYRADRKLRNVLKSDMGTVRRRAPSTPYPREFLNLVMTAQKACLVARELYRRHKTFTFPKILRPLYSKTEWAELKLLEGPHSAGSGRTPEPDVSKKIGVGISEFPLDGTDWLLLKILAKHSNRTFVAVELQAECPKERPLSTKTIGERIKRLLNAGLINRPKGPRRGVMITLKGVEYLRPPKGPL